MSVFVCGMFLSLCAGVMCDAFRVHVCVETPSEPFTLAVNLVQPTLSQKYHFTLLGNE